MSRLLSGWDALQTRLAQNVETVSRRHRLGVYSRNVNRIELAEDVHEYRDHFYTTPIVRASINNFASDVIEPGYRVEADSGDTADYLETEWLPQAAIVAGEKHKDALPLLKLCVKERWAAGGNLIEHVRPEATADIVTGMNLIRPETVKAHTEPNKNILLDPDPANLPDGAQARRTARDEIAAYVQFDDGVAVGSDNTSIPLSQNDVTKSVLNPRIDDTWGAAVTETLNEDITGFKNILRDNEEAIKTKAYGLWSIAFGRDVLEYETEEGMVSEIIEWSDDEQDEFVNERVKGAGPGDIIAHDGEIEFEKFEPDVPDLIDELTFYVSNITTALPTPKYVVGFEKDINQFVTERQDERYQKLIDEERQALERDLSPLLETVAEQQGYNPSGVRLKIEPETDESLIMTLDNETVERIDTYADAVQKIEMAATLTDEEKRELILQLPGTPEIGTLEEEPLDESDPQVQEQAANLEQAMED